MRDEVDLEEGSSGYVRGIEWRWDNDGVEKEEGWS